MANVLVIEDDQSARNTLEKVLKKDGHAVETAEGGIPGVAKFEEGGHDLVLLDLKMPDLDGRTVLKRIMRIDPEIPVIVMTAYASVDNAVDCMKSGAYDFVQKPLNLKELRAVIEKALEHENLKRENRALRDELTDRFSFPNIVAVSSAMQGVFNVIRQVAPTNATVLITGESGTGKELVANALHYNSLRAKKPFVKVNCAALSESLLESELFGHEKGAFTGAISQRKGHFEVADGGTLFIDEIGDVAPMTQVKLLRFMQEKEFNRVGNSIPIKVDVRLITATNADLKQKIAAGTFREDLFFRINAVRIDIPALRERPEDIAPLAEHFAKLHARENSMKVREIAPETFKALEAYEWPGNIRELENAIETAVVLGGKPVITPDDLPAHIRCREGGKPTVSIPIGASLKDTEKEMIERTLKSTRGNKTQAAKILGIGTKTLYRKIKEYNLET